MKQTGEVMTQTRVSPGYYLMEVRCPSVADGSHPGQFVHVRCTGGLDPLLRRPLSIHRVNRQHGSFALLYRVQGKGTQLLSQKRPGDKLDLLGPLGKGFNLSLGIPTRACIHSGAKPDASLGNGFEAEPGSARDREEAVLAAGGIGVAPLVYLAEELLALGRRVLFLVGARSASDLVALGALEELQEGCHDRLRVVICTDDGSVGFRGSVAVPLEETVACRRVAAVFACGPEAMLARVIEICRQGGVPGQVSLEARMACGVGACLGCACRLHSDPGQGWPSLEPGKAVHPGTPDGSGIRTGSGKPVYAKVCREGPVFDMEEVIPE